MTVWVVEDHEYEGDWILGVYATLEAAQQHHAGHWRVERNVIDPSSEWWSNGKETITAHEVQE